VFAGLKNNLSLETINFSCLDVYDMDWFEDFRSFLECNTFLKKLYFAGTMEQVFGGTRFNAANIPDICSSLDLNFSLSLLDLSHCFACQENVLQLLYVALKDNCTLSVLLLHNNTFLADDKVWPLW
jgi:hypothetical protein